MARLRQEIRDPIHNFISVDDTEMKIINSPVFQRLRYIHQLAMTYLVYPGATHRRFEHSLGVMHLAGTVLDQITDERRGIREEVRSQFNKQIIDELSIWRRTVRIAALCHDIGHLPFSHAAEDRLLKDDKKHEHITIDLIERYIQPILSEGPLNWKTIAKISVGRKKWSDYCNQNSLQEQDKYLSEWEEILSEIITGDSFGVDRMDYLLRDAYHAGVAYGIFDFPRMIDTIKILPREQGSNEYALGMERSGLSTAETLLLSRHYMYTEVYFHRTRRIYNYHLQEFMINEYGENQFPIEPEEFIKITDNEILSLIAKSENEHAKRMRERNHFKLAYHDKSVDVESLKSKVIEKFGNDCYIDCYYKENSKNDFPVENRDGEVASSLYVSSALQNLPSIDFGYIFCDGDEKDKMQEFINEQKGNKKHD